MSNIEGMSLTKLLDNVQQAVVIYQWDTSVIYANPTALKLLRLTHDQIIGRDAMDPGWSLIDETGRRIHIDEYPANKVKRFQSSLSGEVLGVVDSLDKDVTWLSINARIQRNETGQDHFILMTLTDVTRDMLLFSFSDIVQNANDIVIVTDASIIDDPLGPRIVYVNAAFENLTGYSSEEVIGETPRILQGKHTGRESLDRIRQALDQRKPVRETVLNYSRSGHAYWLEMSIFPLKNRYGQITHFASIERDVTEQIYHAEQLEKRNQDLKLLKKDLQLIVSDQTEKLRYANRELERLAYYDSLTGIPNRRSFMEQAKRNLALCDRHRFSILVGILDLDNFKQINDTHGHDVGDEVLSFAARKLTAFFRESDVFGRIGGEEFGFMLVLEKDADAMSTIEQLRLHLASSAFESIDKRSIPITASIGGSIADPSGRLSLKTELSKADQALYCAKHSGRNRAIIHEA